MGLCIYAPQKRIPRLSIKNLNDLIGCGNLGTCWYKNVFHEDVTNVIIDDLIKLLDPWEIEVVGDFSVRGNIKTVIRANHKK